MTQADEIEIAAECHGVRVPASGYLNETRIERINAGRYEGDEIRGALSVVKPGQRVLELGAGIGLVGAVVARNCAPEKVLSFEANPALLPVMEALYHANALSDVIEARNEVLWAGPDRPDEVSFYVHKSYLGSTLSPADPRRMTEVKVATRDFDALCADFSPDVLVMDIEGGEQQILAHADLSGVRSVVLEFHPNVYGVEGMRDCKGILKDAGFHRLDAVSTRTVWTCSRET